MERDPASHRPSRLEPIERFFTGWAFAALTIATLGLFAVLTTAILLLPASNDALGGFADQFRVWCFGYDPATKSMRWGLVGATYSELLLFMGIVFVLWRAPLRLRAQGGARAFAPAFVVAASVVVAMAGGFALLADGRVPVDPSVFPGRAIRTSLPSPSLDLVDQEGAAVTLEGLRGRVVLVTAVYASCGLACPRIMGQAKRAVATLTDAERANLTVLGVTLDPEHDDRKQLKRMADAQQVTAPLYHLLTGSAADVNRALDSFDITRRKDPATGVIDHANVFILIDRSGRVAFHFTLNDVQERWLGEAMKMLLAERLVTATRE